MNVTSIHLYSNLDYTAPSVKHAEFNLVNVNKSDSYIIKGMTGLDVEEVIHRYYANNVDNNLNYYNAVMNPRTVVMAVRLNPQYQYGETPELLRRNLQKMISYTRNSLIELRFMNGTTHISSLYGLITKFESALFSADPEIQITFRCDQPLFLAPTETSVSVSGVRTDTKSWTDNLSTAPHGFKMQISLPSKNTNYIKIQGISGQTVSPFNFVIDLPFVNSELYFSSEINNRYLYVISGGNTYNLANEIDSFSIWPMMYPGETSIEIDTDPLTTNDFVFQSITYRPAYWGL